MADYTLAIPLLKKEEGGLSRNPSDSASAYPVPDGSGYHTNQGITWRTWSSYFGSGTNSIKRWYAMSPSDWGTIYKIGFWDKISGDKIKDNSIAILLADWDFMSGNNAVKHLQRVLNNQFGYSLVVDGDMGAKTIAATNAENASDLLSALDKDKRAYFNSLVAVNPQDKTFIKGWITRADRVLSYAKANAGTALISLGGIITLFGLFFLGKYIYNERRKIK